MKKRTVLFVDDEINILSSLRRGLIDEDYRCIFANSGAEALNILDKEEVSVIVSDMKMPFMDGLKLLKIVKEKYPNIVRIVLSGYTQLPQVLVTVNQADIFKFVTKPWNMEEEFIPIIQQAIEYYELQKEKEELRGALEKRNIMYQNILRSTEKKLKTDKKDIEKIRMTGSFIFSNLKVKLETLSQQERLTKKDILQYIGLLEVMHQHYISAVLMSNVEFKLKMLISDLESYLAKVPNVRSYEIKSGAIEDINCYGNHKLIMIILDYIFKYILSPAGEYKLTYNILHQTEGSSINLSSLIELKSENAADMYKYNETVELAQAFVNELCKLLDGKVDIQTNKNITIIKIYIKFSNLNAIVRE